MRDDWVYNNEEESEMGQLHAMHINMNAVAEIQRKLTKQAASPSLQHCEDCGEDIPLARQQLIPGVTRCVHCQSVVERAC